MDVDEICYQKNKDLLLDLERKGVREGPRYHLLSAGCLAYEMLCDIQSNSRFYAPKALKQLMEGKSITAVVKYPDKKHKSLALWIEPDNQEESFVFHLKELAFSLNDRNTYLDVWPQDVLHMKQWITVSIKILRKELLNAYDLMFFSGVIQDLCDWCYDYLRGIHSDCSELLRQLNDSKNRLCPLLEKVDCRLLEAARKQKAAEKQKHEKSLRRKSDAQLEKEADPQIHKEEQWNLFNDKKMLERYPEPEARECAVLRKLPYCDGYKKRSMVRRLDRESEKPKK